MMNSFDKDQFSREALAPVNSRSTTITFIMMHVLGKNSENQEKLTKAWPYLKHGTMIARNNGSFHEYDIDLVYTLNVQYITDLDFDVEDEEADDLDSEYITRRFNARDMKEPEWGSERTEPIIYFLPEEEYKYFITSAGWKDWYFTNEEREQYSQYSNPIQITGLKQLKDLMDTEMIHALRNWEISRNGGG